MNEAKHRIALANADYEDLKEEGAIFNMRQVERRWKLKPGQLRNYRANKNRRWDRGIMLEFNELIPTKYKLVAPKPLICSH